MACDVNLILIAREGRREADHELHTAIFAAQGAKLPPLDPDDAKPVLTREKVLDIAKAHNAAFARKSKPSPGGAKQQAR